MRFLFLIVFCLGTSIAFGQNKKVKKIMQVLEQQTAAWNRGDIESYMQTYWKNDSLLFIGKNGVQRGWETTLKNYKKAYPDTTAMGKLSFNILKMKKLSGKYYYVVGKWMLNRSIGNLSGHFDLLLRKINGQWLIISDHSS